LQSAREFCGELRPTKNNVTTVKLLAITSSFITILSHRNTHNHTFHFSCPQENPAKGGKNDLLGLKQKITKV